MAMAVQTNGLQHAISLGNIEISAKSNNIHVQRCYDSEDETMTRRKSRPQSAGFFPRGSVYSKGDIKEQYCLTDRQLQNSVERPRRERFFGCLSGRGSQQSFLGVCVGRRAPSDENLADYAPFYKYPRYHHQNSLPYDDLNLGNNSYFQRRPASILSGPSSAIIADGKRYSWTPDGEDSNLLEGSRLYQCPAHIGLPPPPPPPVVTNIESSTPRTKHVSFARSHTLTSFDEAAALGLRSSGRSITSIRSQERLIGGKKTDMPTGIFQIQHPQTHDQLLQHQFSMTGPIQAYHQPQPQQNQSQLQQPQAPQIISFHHHHPHQLMAHKHALQQQIIQQQHFEQQQNQTQQSLPQHPSMTNLAGATLSQPTTVLGFMVTQQPHPQQHLIPPTHQLHQHQSSLSPEVVVVEKIKRGTMKNQTTQTDVRKRIASHPNLSLSPRTIHRVKMVSQGAQTNGMINGRKLTKSLSEMVTGTKLLRSSPVQTGDQYNLPNSNESRLQLEHEHLHRTYSEEPPRSPSMIINQHQYRFYEPPPPPIGLMPTHSRASSRTSTELPPSSFERLSIGHSRNLSEDSSMGVSSSVDPGAPLLYTSFPPSGTSSIATQAGFGMTTTSTKNSQDIYSLYQFDAENPLGLEGRLSRQSYDSHHSVYPTDFEPNSLPRRTCNHYKPGEDFYTSLSLPRGDLHQHQETCRHATECAELFQNGNHLVPLHSRSFRKNLSRESSTDSAKVTETERRRRASAVGLEMVPKIHFHIAYRRPSMPVATQPHISPPQIVPQRSHRKCLSSETDDDVTAKSEEDDDAEVPCSEKGKTIRKKLQEEKEIFIDFKPHMSPKPSPRRKKKLQKAMSDGAEMQLGQNQDRGSILIASASEEDVRVGDDDEESKKYYYQNIPIRDEGIFDKRQDPNLLSLPTEVEPISPRTREKREAFRKRSISLEDPTGGDETARQLKSAPPSPCQEEVPNVQSAYPSSDSLANDLTRDISDGIWNESQVTVLTADSLKSNEVTLLTPTSKRKNLILQHQQRSSIDTDALELEEQFSDQSLPMITSPKLKPAATQTTMSTTTSTLLTVPLAHSTPSIAVTPSQNQAELDDQLINKPISRRSSRTLSPALYDRRKIEPLVHSHSPIKIPSESLSVQTASLNQYDRRDLIPKATNTTDISECSTNTDEYVTCTDNSKRTPGIKTPPTTASSSSTQVPVSAQSSQTAQEGSSFESASSLYSTRGDGLSEDNPQTDDLHSIEPELSSLISQPTQIVVADPLITPPSTVILPPKLHQSSSATKLSPTHSVSSSSSDSYIVTDITRQKSPLIGMTLQTTVTVTSGQKATSPMRVHHGGVAAAIRASAKKKSESISDDEKSEKRYSSSGYYASPQDEEQLRTTAKLRRVRLEEERRRRKNNMKLDIERENLRALTSPIKKPSTQTKTNKSSPILSPEDRVVALNVLDGTSPNKMKRFRPKIKRQPKRTSITETQSISTTSTLRRAKPVMKSPEKVIERYTKNEPTIVSPCKYENKISATTFHQPLICDVNGSISEKRLKAKSIESLRSVSPGSDSVFYSEADAHPEQQVHCLHCGKEVEIITAVLGSQESIPIIENEEPDIVKPPADFADSPITTKTSQRLYKKMDKRFRSEDRHGGDRGRHYRSRQENVRAKSEERGKDVFNRSPPNTLRPTGSSPCVLPDVNDDRDLDQIIYKGHFRDGKYSRLTDSDVWIQLDHHSFEHQRGRRGSTESEKAFHQKYQVILHRLVQRRCTLEMYQRQKQNVFKLISRSSPQTSVRRKLEDVLRLMLIVWAREGQALKFVSGKENEIDKTVFVKSDSGEFGFRIHGSKPVVVAAIEPDTPAESSGLEVGDILISVNGIPVLDKHHTEVVKIAHAGCETLELQVARTIGVLMAEQQESASPALYTGYLWRQSGQARGSPNKRKWVRRWFSLRPDHCLYYYKTDADNQPVGAVILTKHTVGHCPPDCGRPFAFKIDSGEGIPLFLAADTEEGANRWVAIMSHASTQPDPWLEMSTRNLRLPPSSIQRPDCFGYLMKLGSRWCGWSKRYCVLSNACVYLYQDANSKNAIGMVCLQGYKVVAMSINAAGRKNSFELVPPENKLRHYYFSTELEMDKKRWISALEYSIDRWIKAA